MFWQAAIYDSNTLPVKTTFDPASPDFYKTHKIRFFPPRGAPVNFGVPLDQVRITLQVKIQPVGRTSSTTWWPAVTSTPESRGDAHPPGGRHAGVDLRPPRPRPTSIGRPGGRCSARRTPTSTSRRTSSPRRSGPVARRSGCHDLRLAEQQALDEEGQRRADHQPGPERHPPLGGAGRPAHRLLAEVGLQLRLVQPGEVAVRRVEGGRRTASRRPAAPRRRAGGTARARARDRPRSAVVGLARHRHLAPRRGTCTVRTGV